MLVTGRVVAVADGLGGHAAGEVASKIAVDRMRELGDVDNLHPDQIIDAILDTNGLILAADARPPGQRRHGHHARRRRHRDDGRLPSTASCSTSATRACTGWSTATSRRSRSTTARCRSCRTPGRSAPRRPPSTRAATSSPGAWAPTPRRCPTSGSSCPSAHERFVICSDGLSGEVDDAAIAATVRQAATPKEAAESLLQQALDGGGRDNVTVIVVDMANGSPEQSVTAAPGGRPRLPPTPPADGAAAPRRPPHEDVAGGSSRRPQGRSDGTRHGGLVPHDMTRAGR